MIIKEDKINRIILEEVREVMLEQFTGDHLVAALQAVIQSRTDASVKNQMRSPKTPEMMLAKELSDLGLDSQLYNTLKNKELEPNLINQALKLIFKKVKDRPDAGKLGVFDQFFNLDDNILAVLDEETINEIMIELEGIMNNAMVAPGAPIDMTLPMIRDIFMQVLQQKTGLVPMGI